MKELNDLWLEACLELWKLSENRPYIRETATLWDAFKYMYMKAVPRQCRSDLDVS
jgi:hypothetical protein